MFHCLVMGANAKRGSRKQNEIPYNRGIKHTSLLSTYSLLSTLRSRSFHSILGRILIKRIPYILLRHCVISTMARCGTAR